MSASNSEGSRPLLTVDDLRAAATSPRSRLGRLFGVTSKDLSAAKRRLVQTVEQSASNSSGASDGAPPPERGGYRQPMEPANPGLRSRHDEQIASPGASNPSGFTEGDHLVDESSHEGERRRGPDSALGYRGPTACNAAGITYRQLDYWARTGLVPPSIRATGPGTQRLYSVRDIVELKIIKRLLDAGISLPQIRTGIEHLRHFNANALTAVTLMSDGRSVYECTSSDEVLDLLQSGVGVFGIAVGGVWREVQRILTELPGEPASVPATSEEQDEVFLETWRHFRSILAHSLEQVDQLPPQEQLAVASLFTELGMPEQFSELEGVVHLDAARRRREQRPERPDSSGSEQAQALDG